MTIPVSVPVEVGDDECDGSHITRPHRFTYGNGNYSQICQRSDCRIGGTGDRCGDGECEGGLDPDEVPDSMPESNRVAW